MVDLRFSESELASRRDRIVSFLEAQVDAAGAKGAVLGLSGGIDSSTVAHLAVEALGAKHVHGLVMPGVVSDDDNMSDAEWVAQDLGIPHDVVPIDGVVEAITSAYPDASDDRVAVGNARARTRAVLSYLVANHEDRLVLGTGNRSEALVGYYTKYGDGAVDCHPIGNCYKVQVRQLARDLGVPQDVVEKPPTAGLWEGQTDEAELGISYDVLDPILALCVDGPLSPEATARELDVDVETVEDVLERYHASSHKRSVPPTPPQ